MRHDMDSFWIAAAMTWKDAKIILASAFALLVPIKGLLIAVGVIIVIDTIMGIYAASKTGKKITSRRFSSVLSKMLIYQSVVIVAYAMDKLILGEFTALFVDINLLTTKVATLFVIGSELFSIDEKFRIINNGKGTWYQFKRLMGVAKMVRKETKDLDIDTDAIVEKAKKAPTEPIDEPKSQDDGTDMSVIN